MTWDSRDHLGRPELIRLGQGASASLSPIASARGVAVVPADVSRIVPGSPLAVEPFD